MSAKRLCISEDLPDHVLVGLSGGADSVALTYLLIARGVQVSAVHVDHALRGEESDGDAAFVRELCAKWQIPLLVYRAAPPPHPGEDWARKVRYGFFRQAMAETGADALALAHHRDDQAETLLLHLLRGAGLTGLTGMAPDATVDGMRILRPLLGVSRQELRQLLTDVGQPWREDASNGDPRYLRNALRGQVLPLLETLTPGASARLAKTAELLRAEETALAARTSVLLAPHQGKDHLPLSLLQGLETAFQRRVLRAWWTGAAGRDRDERNLSSEQTEALLSLVDGKASERCNLPGGWHGQRGWTHLHLVPPGQTAPLTACPLSDCLYIRIEAARGRTGDGVHAQAIPRAWLTEISVRSRGRGDWIIPFGSGGRRSVQDYLTDRRVDAPFRDRVPLLCRGSEVLLVAGIGAGNIPDMTAYDDAVLLTWTEDFPWARP